MLSKMSSSKITGNITKDFILDMIPHHEAAVLMSKNLLKYNIDSKLALIAKNIIRVQENGIKEMRLIYQTTNIPNNTYLEVLDYIRNYNDILNEMARGMQNSLNIPNINLDFISEMIPHHKGAIKMCKNLLNFKIDERLKNLAISIINFQSQGVKELKEIRNCILNN